MKSLSQTPFVRAKILMPLNYIQRPLFQYVTLGWMAHIFSLLQGPTASPKSAFGVPKGNMEQSAPFSLRPKGTTVCREGAGNDPVHSLRKAEVGTAMDSQGTQDRR